MYLRRILAIICVALGVFMVSVPICFHIFGQRRTDELTREFEWILEEKAEETAKNKEDAGENIKEEPAKATLSREDAAIFEEGEVMAIIEIPSLSIRYPVLEGCSAKNLNTGIGHMSETAGIGENGNCVLAGHNGSRYGDFFTSLNRIQQGDEVTLLDREAAVHRYSVCEAFVVGPYDNSIKAQGDAEELTLFTCTQKGTKRFVVKCVPKEGE